MITLEQAIKKVEEETGYNVSSVKDCGESWSVGFKEFAESTGAAATFIFKEDGRIEHKSITLEVLELLERGQKVF
ncbi:MAG: hypothetical protein IJ728_05005 [Selenomonadaceae bacterium]|nr:hypothetical protein [Selenomonadaceae bacterium]